uniref:hypothetical protein n=1 Tax=Piscirickettsia salmonis TaxID=1238 RepID=UPI0039F65A4D
MQQCRFDYDRERTKNFMEKYKVYPQYSFTQNPYAFCRMLAKIAYCYTLLNIDINDFSAICKQYIIDENKNISWIVGSENKRIIYPKEQ